MHKLISHSERWRFVYRGIEYEITKRHGKPLPFWAYYIHVPVNTLPPALLPSFLVPCDVIGGKPVYRIQQSPILQNELSWHAGGPDYYEKIGGHDGKPMFLKIGCGYGQEWEKHVEYEFDNLEWQVKQTIDSLVRLVLNGPSRKY